ncbi:MAG: alpha-2-macroglobulin [Anaerolineae bacterium]|nr:alpha-2-macroglobulin [Anaerolineae bacterium]
MKPSYPHPWAGPLIATALVLTLIASCALAGPRKPSPSAGPGPAQATTEPSDAPTEPFVDEKVDGYLAVAPRVLQSGQRHAISVALFRNKQPANSTVQVSLISGSQRVAAASSQVRGHGQVVLDLPRLPEGEYRLEVQGKGFKAGSPIRVEDSTLVFVETDKPIYKPGQTVHVRVLTLDTQLKPISVPASVEVMDAKGIKVFKKDVETDEFGLASLDMPLSPEPNLGVWKVTASSGKRRAETDVRVERYVLPKYEVKVNLAKEWVLASEPIRGSVAAEYSYGKPVRGELHIVATRYVGVWEEFANLTRPLDGQTDFELPAVQYVSGVPEAGGMGNVQLDITVTEESTGYEEKTTRLLTVAAAPVVLKVIPESVSFKPGLPLNLLVLAETPDGNPVDATVNIDIAYQDSELNFSSQSHQVSVKGGKALLKITPPAKAISLNLSASDGTAYTYLVMQAGYSPTGSFIHLEQVGESTLKVGDRARFHVTATKQARNFYYEVVARGLVVFSNVSQSPDIEFTVTPQMAPEARLLVYQVLPNSEVAADYVPFSVTADYTLSVHAGFDKEEVQPGDRVGVTVETDGQARVGLAAVDRSVFILAENRLNLQQVFAELERLYMKPQVELHEAEFLPKIATRGASEVFEDAGVMVLSNQNVPEGKEYEQPLVFFGRGAGPVARDAQLAVPEKAAVPAAMPSPAPGAEGQLAEVKRVRQFFPETWLWLTLDTDAAGRARTEVEAPDSITTWMLRAVALSKEKGLGISEAQLRVFQPFFLSVDLPYAVIRGEEFPVRVALYNYTAEPQEFLVELEGADWFDLTGEPSARVQVPANSVGGAAFTIRPHELGPRQVKVTARSRTSADAVIKDIIIEPEGVPREVVENLIVSAGTSREVDASFPKGIVSGSARAYLGLTGSYLTQAIEGLEGLLQMPFGCGEQNMILFAPNVFVSRYLQETNQLKPEVMAKAESLMITGYQRELTYRRADGSFSAFGDSDPEGSLWLTAFVLKTFAQAKGLIYIDESVLESARAWIVQHQNADGSFDPVGFVHHQEMLGGLQGKTALTAYVAVALHEAGDTQASARAVRYIEKALYKSDDVYTLALGTYALELAKSPKAQEAYDRLMKLAKEEDGALYWGDLIRAEPLAGEGQRLLPVDNRSAAVETTGYALLALIEHGDRLNASRAARWLVSQRNAYGGYGSTQDTVVGLQALTRFAADSRADVDATITLRSGSWQKEVRISPENADVLQLVDLPTGGKVTVEVKGKGQVVLQAVRRFNVPAAEPGERSAFRIDVRYGTEQVAVNDLIDIDVSVRFTPPEPMKAGMTVLDIAVPTGFSPEEESIAKTVEGLAKIKRYELAGRKVIFYIEDMMPEEEVHFSFQARALYPVRTKAVTSVAYAYYRPELKGESLGGAVVVSE